MFFFVVCVATPTPVQQPLLIQTSQVWCSLNACCTTLASGRGKSCHVSIFTWRAQSINQSIKQQTRNPIKSRKLFKTTHNNGKAGVLHLRPVVLQHKIWWNVSQATRHKRTRQLRGDAVGGLYFHCVIRVADANCQTSSIVQWTNTSFVRNSRLSWRGAGVDYSQPQGRGGEQWKQRRQVAQGVKLTLIERKTIRGGIRGEPPQAARLPWVQFHFRLPRGKYFHEGWKRMLIGRMANMIKRDYSNM